MSAGAVQADELRDAVEIADRLLANVETVVHGKRDEIRLVLTALACEGHVLFEDVPGTAKTVLARAIAQSIEGAVPSRIQCTPDLQPTDVTGLVDLRPAHRATSSSGPGRSSRTSCSSTRSTGRCRRRSRRSSRRWPSGQVTVDGVTRPLPRPFLLLATENPIEHEGTFPLPEAQLDRFFLRTSLGYPSSRGRAPDLRRPADRASARRAPPGRRRRGDRARSSVPSRTCTSTR